MIHVVDTHSLIWHLENWRGLGRNAARVLESSPDELIVPTIVLAEARYTIARKRRNVTWDELLTLRVPLITKDRAIRASGLVETVW